MGLVRRADVLNALSDLFEKESSGNCVERDVAMEQLKERGIPFGGITPDVVKVTRCKNCAYNGLHTCPICYIEKQALIFINHDPEFFCRDGVPKDGTESYQ